MLKTTLAAVWACALFTLSLHAADNAPITKCVVSGEPLKAGHTVEVQYKGRTILLCCKGCIRKFNKEPEKYIAALDAAAKESQGKK